jgi:hypothetical protein
MAGGAPRTAKPISAMSNPKDVLRFQRLANSSIVVTDVQNNTVLVAGQPIMLPRANIFPVDRVLLNGERECCKWTLSIQGHWCLSSIIVSCSASTKGGWCTTADRPPAALVHQHTALAQ